MTRQRLSAVCGAALIAGVLVGSFAADIPAPVADTTLAAPAVRTVAAVRPEPAIVAEVRQRVAKPLRVMIPAIDVDARIRPVGLNLDGSMEVPDFGVAGWYTKGPRPGAPGPAVIVAHVDSFEGPDVFFRLRELRRGQRIHVVRRDGSTAVFRVARRENTPKDRLPADRIWNDTRRPVLRLVTCGGEFDYETRHYTENVIVYAFPVSV